MIKKLLNPLVRHLTQPGHRVGHLYCVGGKVRWEDGEIGMESVQEAINISGGAIVLVPFETRGLHT